LIYNYQDVIQKGFEKQSFIRKEIVLDNDVVILDSNKTINNDNHNHNDTVEQQLQIMKNHHNESIAILSLLPWEKEAIHNLQNGSMECNNPQGIHSTCCPGSFSQGGQVTSSRRIACAQADYSIVETLAQ
jgi:hypothetical protein